MICRRDEILNERLWLIDYNDVYSGPKQKYSPWSRMWALKVSQSEAYIFSEENSVFIRCPSTHSISAFGSRVAFQFECQVSCSQTLRLRSPCRYVTHINMHTDIWKSFPKFGLWIKFIWQFVWQTLFTFPFCSPAHSNLASVFLISNRKL